jgi:hypothetical protein
MSPTEVKVTLIPPPGKAIKIKSPDALANSRRWGTMCGDVGEVLFRRFAS